MNKKPRHYGPKSLQLVGLYGLALIILNTFDVAATNHVLASGASEWNPGMLWIMQSMPNGWQLLKWLLGLLAATALLIAPASSRVWLAAHLALAAYSGLMVWHLIALLMGPETAAHLQSLLLTS